MSKNNILYKTHPRWKTKKIMVGNVQIGGQNDIVIQTMLTEKTWDHKKVLEKINVLHSIGCQIIRLACFSQKDIDALKIITKKSPIPVVADIHYNPIFAIKAIENGVSKIRINPGNIGKKDIQNIVSACKKYNIPIRIGINTGSIQPDILLKYGFTAKSLIESAIKNIKILEDMNFYNIIISVKASDPDIAIKAYTELSILYDYPLHLGITEAGTVLRSAIKSSCALGKLIENNIGDTIRISMSDDPIYEIKAAKELLRYYKIKKNIPNLISCPTCGRLNYDMLPLTKKIENFLDSITGNINIAIMGCSVNGPGEAKHADIAFCGEIDSGDLYVDGKFKRTLVNEEVYEELKKEIIIYLNKKN